MAVALSIHHAAQAVEGCGIRLIAVRYTRSTTQNVMSPHNQQATCIPSCVWRPCLTSRLTTLLHTSHRSGGGPWVGQHSHRCGGRRHHQGAPDQVRHCAAPAGRAPLLAAVHASSLLRALRRGAVRVHRAARHHLGPPLPLLRQAQGLPEPVHAAAHVPVPPCIRHVHASGMCLHTACDAALPMCR